MRATGQPHPFEAASFGVACSSAATVVGEHDLPVPADPGHLHPHRPPAGRRQVQADLARPAATDCGQQYPVTTSRPTAGP